MHPWLRIAHRGASAETPEHTRPAFERAVAAGVDMIELDVQLSRDGVLVVMHDLTLERTTNGRGAVREYDWADLRQLDAGTWFNPRFAGERPLRLEEVIEIAGSRVRLNVELKAPAVDWDDSAALLLRLLERTGRLQGTIISSFQSGALAAVRRASNEAVIGLLWHDAEVAGAWPLAAALRAAAFHPHWPLASRELVAEAHARGLRVIAWTVNDLGAMGELVTRGVDGIISDYPERLIAAARGVTA